MRSIYLFGAGKSATVLIHYLLQNAETDGYRLFVVDANLELAQAKLGTSAFGQAIACDIRDASVLYELAGKADIVISLLPPTLHQLVAEACLHKGKNLLTASYIDDAMRSLEPAIREKGLLFLCEMGLDPGIDHMSAMRIIDQVHDAGGKVENFHSHCGGLVAPESDDNPWHYKISWNPRNIVLAGKAGARYKENGTEVQLNYENLFTTDKLVEIPGLGFLGWYPNRDSLGYASLYGIENASTLIRTTLRHPDFMYGWKNIVELKLTDETPVFDSDGRSLHDFFRFHMAEHQFGNWVQNKLTERLSSTQHLLDNLMKLVDAENKAGEEGKDLPEKFMMVDKQGELEHLDLEEVKTNAAATVAHQMHEANLTIRQLFYLGMDDRSTFIDKGFCSAADVLQLAMEKKLALEPGDKDMVVMLHEIEYRLDNRRYKVESSLVVKGEDDQRTAMAKTVGLPLGITARLILANKIHEKGLLIPVSRSIYQPVLEELEEHGVQFREMILTL